MIPLNRSQCHGLDLDRHLVLNAGAGTGKTTVMSVRYIEHILSEDQRASRHSGDRKHAWSVCPAARRRGEGHER